MFTYKKLISKELIELWKIKGWDSPVIELSTSKNDWLKHKLINKNKMI